MNSAKGVVAKTSIAKRAVRMGCAASAHKFLNQWVFSTEILKNLNTHSLYNPLGRTKTTCKMPYV